MSPRPFHSALPVGQKATVQAGRLPVVVERVVSRMLITANFAIKNPALAGMAQKDLSAGQFDSQSGHMPGLWAMSPVGG